MLPTLGPGGMELATGRVIAALSGMRHSIACLKGMPLAAERFDAPATVHCMNARRHDPRLPWRLCSLIRRIRPTVIHARNWSAWPDISAARLMAAAVDGHAVPLVFSFHGLDTSERMPLRRRIACRILAGFTDRIFTVASAARDLLVTQAHLPARRVEIIPNGVDVACFSPRSGRRKPGPLRIGTVGSLTPVKNQALLLRAVGAVVGQGVDCTVGIAGDGPRRGNLETLAESLGIAERIELLGRVEDVPAFLRELDVFVLPSRSEAHPNALLEAMACGLPCVATDVGGVRDVLAGGRCGLLVRPGDAAGLVSALGRLKKGAAVRKKLGRDARERVVAVYSMERMAEAYGELYRNPRLSRRRLSCAPAPRPSVVMLGPLPPPPGGMATVFDNLRRSSLRRTCRLEVLNTGKTTRPGRPVVQGVAAQLLLAGRLVRTIVAGGAQLLHIHTCSGLTFWRDCLLAQAGRILGCKVIWHVHGGMFADFLASLTPARRALARWQLASASAVIVLGEQWLGRLWPFAPRAKWRVIPNGVAIPPPRQYAPGPARVLFMGDLSANKGAPDLVEAVGRAVEKHSFAGTVSLAGGEGAAGQRAELAQRISTGAAAGRVKLLGVVAGQAKADALAAAEVFALPSYAEALPMAMLEAMAAGMAIVAAPVGSIGEVVTDGEEGFLVPPGDVDALAERLARLDADADLRRRMGQAARRTVERRFALDIMVGRLSELYGEIDGPRTQREQVH